VRNTSYTYYFHCNSLHWRIAAYAHDNILPVCIVLDGTMLLFLVLYNLSCITTHSRPTTMQSLILIQRRGWSGRIASLPLFCMSSFLPSFLFYRQDCRVAANCRYCFYSQAKNEVFRPAGATRCTDSDQTLQYRRASGSTWLCKISRQSVQTGGNAAQKNIKNFHFLVKSRPAGATSFTDVQNFQGPLYV